MSATSIDHQFIEFIVKSLVSNPDKVKIERTIDEKGVLLALRVDPEDLGRVIGKRGATAQSLRTLLRALGTKNDARYNLKIVDDGERPKPKSEPSAESKKDKQPKDEKKQEADEDPEKDETEVPKETTEDDSDVVAKTRKELDDLDDLDI